MMRLVSVSCVAALWFASASSADAAKVGDKLYIKAKNTKVMKAPKATASVVAVAQPGQEVVWRGSVRKAKSWHKVTFEGQRGVVFRSTLSTKRPSLEMTKSGQQVDAVAFASSGAATKALGSGAKTYGDRNNLQSAVQSITLLERIAKTVKPKHIARHVERNKLAPNVGAEQ